MNTSSRANPSAALRGANTDAAPSAPMSVFTYASGSEDLPPHERAIARIKCPQVTGFGKTRAIRDDWHPVIFHAETQAEAGAKAVRWWDAEVERERAKADNNVKRVAAMKERRVTAKADTSERSVLAREDHS